MLITGAPVALPSQTKEIILRIFEGDRDTFVVIRSPSSVPVWRPSANATVKWGHLVRDSHALKASIPRNCRMADTFAALPRPARGEALAEVARAGRTLFRTLLPDPADREIFKQLLAEAEGHTIRAPGFAASVPWEAIYIGDDPDAPDIEHFVGWAHRFHRSLGDDGRLTFAKHEPRSQVAPIGLIEDDGLTSVITGFNRTSNPILTSGGRILPGLSHRSELKTLEEFLYNSSSPATGIFHFDCHMQRKANAPAIRHSHINIRSTVPVDFDRFADMRITKGAFVFFNVCEGGATAFDDETTYAGTLVTNGADSVVAVEAEIGDEFAADFARRFYEHMLKGTSVGDAVFATRRDVLFETQNPSALFFGVYGLETYRLVEPANADEPQLGKASA